MKRSAALLALVLAVTGCVNTSFTSPDGTAFKTSRFLYNGQIARAGMTNTNGATVSIEGYTSDAAEVANAVASGIAKGLVQGAKK